MRMTKKILYIYISFAVALLLSLFCITKAKTTVVGACVTIPIFCYHDILPLDKIPADKRGENDIWTITTSEFENDVMYLLKRGYVPISMSDYISNSYMGKPLTNNMFVITIDDGNKSNLLYVLPILEKYNIPATLCLIGDRLDSSDEKEATENPYGKFLSSDDVRKLAESPLIEFASHSDKMHIQLEQGRQGTLMLPDESTNEYRKALLGDLVPFKKRIEELTGKPCNVFTYPFGYVNINSLAILKEAGFKANLMLENKCTYYYGNEQELQQQYRFMRTNARMTSGFFTEIVGIK